MEGYNSTINGAVAIDCPHCAEGISHLIGYHQYFDEDSELCLHLVFACEAGHYFEKCIARDEDGTLLLTDEDNVEDNI